VDTQIVCTGITQPNTDNEKQQQNCGVGIQVGWQQKKKRYRGKRTKGTGRDGGKPGPCPKGQKICRTGQQLLFANWVICHASLPIAWQQPVCPAHRSRIYGPDLRRIAW